MRDILVRLRTDAGQLTIAELIQEREGAACEIESSASPDPAHVGRHRSENRCRRRAVAPSIAPAARGNDGCTATSGGESQHSEPATSPGATVCGNIRRLTRRVIKCPDVESM